MDTVAISVLLLKGRMRWTCSPDYKRLLPSFLELPKKRRAASNSSKLNVRRYFPGVKQKHGAQEYYFSQFLAKFFVAQATRGLLDDAPPALDLGADMPPQCFG
jgi:hypothetical protein